MRFANGEEGKEGDVPRPACFLLVIVSAKSCSIIQHFKFKSCAVGSADLKHSTVNTPMLEAPMGTVRIFN